MNYQFKPLKLRAGAGGDWNNGLCFMEAVAWMAGEDLATDQPDCADPVLTWLGISINDAAEQDVRDRLQEFILPMTGTRGANGDKNVMEMRADFIITMICKHILHVLFKDIGEDQCAFYVKNVKCIDEMIHFRKDAKHRFSGVNDPVTYIIYGTDDPRTFEIGWKIEYTGRYLVQMIMRALSYLKSRNFVHREPIVPEDIGMVETNLSHVKPEDLTTTEIIHTWQSRKDWAFDKLIYILHMAILVGPNAMDEWEKLKPRAEKLVQHARELQNA